MLSLMQTSTCAQDGRSNRPQRPRAGRGGHHGAQRAQCESGRRRAGYGSAADRTLRAAQTACRVAGLWLSISRRCLFSSLAPNMALVTASEYQKGGAVVTGTELFFPARINKRSRADLVDYVVRHTSAQRLAYPVCFHLELLRVDVVAHLEHHAHACCQPGHASRLDDQLLEFGLGSRAESPTHPRSRPTRTSDQALFQHPESARAESATQSTASAGPG